MSLLACERELDISMDAQPPVVVNALFNTDSTWRVGVTRAWAMGEFIYGRDQPSRDIENAGVYITSGIGEHITLVHDTLGYYQSPLKPRAGETYTLLVDVPGEPPLTSSIALPEPVRPDTCYITKLSEYNYLFTLEFTDPPGPTSYELNLYEGSSGDLRFGKQLETDDPDVYVEYYWTPVVGLGPILWALNDRNFEGQKKKLVFRMHQSWEFPEEWTVQMRTATDEYARYRTTALQQQETYSDPFAQPIQVYNNIDNGVGIFAGYSRIDYRFKGQ